MLAIPGTSSVQHFRDNLRAAALLLPADTLAKLDALTAESEQNLK
jgi:aryl-alcohol dehydrogenase-like predicted oxidoreductase